MSAPDPFWWDENDEDETRAICKCGWQGPWREHLRTVRKDERGHACDQATAWRADL